MSSARRHAFVLAVAPLFTCTPTSQPSYVAASSTIVASADEQSVWVTSPDDDTVVQIAATSLAVLQSISVGGTPEQLAWVGARLLVTQSQSSSVASIDPGNGSVGQIAVPCGGTRAVVATGATQPTTAFVSCPNDDVLVELDLDAATVVRIVAAPGRPTSLAVAGDELAVTASRTGELRVFSIHAIESTPSGTGAIVPLATTQLDDLALGPGGGVSATSVDAIAADSQSRNFVAAFQRVDNDANRDLAPTSGGYGSVVDGDPRIEPRLFAGCGTHYAQFDGGPDVFSGASALAYGASSGVLWIAHRFTDNIAVLRCPLAPLPSTTAPLTAVSDPAHDTTVVPNLVTFQTGRAPRGIALTADGQTAFVDDGFDHAVSRLDLTDAASLGAGTPPVRSATLTLRRPVGSTALSDTALTGRSLFFDATNSHLTPSGIVTCGSCHPDGADDGASWFIHTVNIPRKFRRSPPAWGGRTSLAPFHWDGSFTDDAMLEETNIVELMGGDGLLVNTSAIAEWLDEMPLPPTPPLAGDALASANRGEALFASSGCASCHAGAMYTDLMLHSVLAPSSDPDAQLESVDTPSLVAVRNRAPYLHDGRAATLLDVLTTQNVGDTHGSTSTLSAQDLQDLLSYLASL